MATKAISDTSFTDDVLSADKPVLVDFWADWCGPCKMIAPALEELSDELADQVTITKANLDDAPDSAAKYGIRTIPNLVLFKNGEEVARFSRAAPKGQLKAWLEGALA
ncbi:MAG: thiol reductase thioredoxin [Proteobacteria bacterium SG_bin6]|jgi:thioredoxin 1|nr:MAG: thiol reductase thioredoxin [Proteobacteria bacterium SG_bin6]